MDWIANHLWLVALIANGLVLAPFAWTVYSPGTGPDGAMEASMLFFFGVAGTAIIWGLFGAWHLLIWFLNMFQT